MESTTAIDRPCSLPRLIAALLLGTMTAGSVIGGVEGAWRPGRVDPGETFLGHVAWRAASATIAAAACGAIAYLFLRPLTRGGAVFAVLMPMFATLRGFHRESFLYDLACFAILMGPLCGVLYRITLDSGKGRWRFNGAHHTRRRFVSEPTSRTSPNELRAVLRLILAWLVGGATCGLLLGLCEWNFEPERLAPGATLAAHVAWRAFSSMAFTTIGGLVIYAVARPVVLPDPLAVGGLPIVLSFQQTSPATFLHRLLVAVIPLGLLFGACLRLGRGGRPSSDAGRGAGAGQADESMPPTPKGPSG